MSTSKHNFCVVISYCEYLILFYGRLGSSRQYHSVALAMVTTTTLFYGRLGRLEAVSADWGPSRGESAVSDIGKRSLVGNQREMTRLVALYFRFSGDVQPEHGGLQQA